MKKDEQLESKKRLEHILSAIYVIEKYATNENEKSFCEKDILNNAVLFQFSVIGEAIIHVDQNRLNKYDYSWYKVRSFRNLIAHEYFNIKLSAVWNIIINDLPELKKIIVQILESEF